VLWGEHRYRRGFLSTKVPTEKMLICPLLSTARLFLCSPIHASPLLFFFFFIHGKRRSRSQQSIPCLPSCPLGRARSPRPAGSSRCCDRLPRAQGSVGKAEMAARQVSCWFSCSSFLLLAEKDLNFFSFFFFSWLLWATMNSS